MGRIEEELGEIVTMLGDWQLSVERKMAFIRSDGAPMLYVRAKTREHYLHVEGMIVGDELRFYCKLTKSERNKHAHRDELIGWDNLYNERPHIHYSEDARREYREKRISWEEVKATIERLEGHSGN